MTTVALLMLAAAVGFGVSTWTRLPIALTCIVAGLHISLFSPIDRALVEEVLLLAAAFLVFAVGTEIDHRQLAPFRGRAWGIAAVQFTLLAAAGLAIGAWLDFDAMTVAYLVMALAGSSTLQVVELLGQRGRTFEPVGRMTFAVSVAQDVLVMIGLALVPGLLAGAGSTLHDALVLAGLVAAALACRRWLAPTVMLGRGLDDEEQLLFVLAVLFCFLGAAHELGLPAVTGVFLGGAALSRFPVGALVRGYVTTFSDFFSAALYVGLGALLTLPSLRELSAQLAAVLVFPLLGLLLMFPLFRRAGLPARPSLEGAAMLAQCGELAVVVVLVGRHRGHIAEGLVDVVVVVAALTLAAAPWLSSDAVAWRLTRLLPLRRQAEPRSTPQDHLLLLGCGDAGQALLESLQGRSIPVVVVDDDPAVIRQLRARGITALRGDGLDPEVLRAAGVDSARALVSTLRRPSDHAHLLSMVRGPHVFVRVFSREEAQAVREQGGHPLVESELAAAAFLRWLDRDAPRSSENTHDRA